MRNVRINSINKRSQFFFTAPWLAMLLLTLPLVAAAQGRIAFVSNRDGNNEIYVMDPDGSNQTRLTNHPADDLQPAFSRDGSRIAFASRRDGNLEIYVMNANGSNPVRLTSNTADDLDPAFSPDGSKIVFTSYSQNGNGQIYTMNADGSNQFEVSAGFISNAVQPEFSPDGLTIVFSDGFDIKVTSIFGSFPASLTFNREFNEYPTYSSDGSVIAFTTRRNGFSFISSLDVNTGQIEGIPTLGMHPSYNPDGSKITFASDSDGDLEIYVARPVTLTNPEPLTNNSYDDFDPNWGGFPTPPSLSNVMVTSPVSENGSATLSGSIFSQITSTAQLTVNWGDGSMPQIFNLNLSGGTTSLFSQTHQYADDNPTATAADNYTINLTLVSGGGESTTVSTIVTVNNVAPTLSGVALNSATIPAGGTVTISGTVTDVGTQDTHAVRINWGDGSPVTNLDFPAAGVTPFSATHQYNLTGNFKVIVTSSDDDGASATASAIVSVIASAPPDAPTNLRVDYVGANQVNLRWNDNASNETGFAIEQCRNPNCRDAVLIGQVAANITTFLHSGLLNNRQYHYRVRAFNNIGASAYSNTITAKTLK